MIKYPTNTIQRCIDCDGSTSLPIGQSGQDGEYGGYSSLWKFSTNTTPGDPGVNYLRIDSGLTNIYVSTTNGDNTNLVAFLASFDDTGANGNYGFIRLFKEYDSNTHKLFKLTRVNNNGTYYTLEVTFISANNSFNNNENIVLSFQPAGITGSAPTITNFLYVNANMPEIANNVGDIELKRGYLLIPSVVNVEDDPLNAYDPLTGLWTCPTNGYYDISFLIGFTLGSFDTTTGYVYGGLTNEGAIASIIACSDISTISTSGSGPGAIQLSSAQTMRKIAAGSKLGVRILNKSGVTIVPAPGSSAHMNIKLVQTY